MSKASDNIDEIGPDIIADAEQAQDEAGERIAQALQAEIAGVGAVRSGRFMRTVKARAAIRPGDVRTIVIESDVDYSAFPEFGRRGKGGYPGKYPHKRTIEKHAGRIIGDAFDNRMRRDGGI